MIRTRAGKKVRPGRTLLLIHVPPRLKPWATHPEDMGHLSFSDTARENAPGSFSFDITAQTVEDDSGIIQGTFDPARDGRGFCNGMPGKHQCL